MDNYILKLIKDTTEYIEDNILEPLSLDDIAGNVNLSKFHLLRIWKGATSTGLMEYVRRRRIALSLADLISQNNSIDFISSKYAFGCERTYNRVFKDEYNTTPAKWRRNPRELKILDRFNADFMSCAGDGLLFYRSTVILPAFSIAGLEYKIISEDNKKNLTATNVGVDFFYNHRDRIINIAEKDVYIGFTAVPEAPEGFTIYQPSVKISSDSIIPGDMKVKHVSAHKYGVFTYMGLHRPEDISAEMLGPIWRYVFETWMPTVRFNLRETFSFEYVNYAKCSKHYCECDLYFPISAL
jgi:AraC family transcriptional regulator